jgi:hypothetical protein
MAMSETESPEIAGLCIEDTTGDPATELAADA